VRVEEVKSYIFLGWRIKADHGGAITDGWEGPRVFARSLWVVSFPLHDFYGIQRKED
jgi:hypothetical protein